MEKCQANRIEGMIDRQVQAAVISRDDPILNELATGRGEDMLDVEKLRAASKESVANA